MNDTTPVKNVLVFLALVASLPRVYKLSQAFRGSVTFKVWADSVHVERVDQNGTFSWSVHAVGQARELWARYKAEGFQALDNDVQVKSEIRG